MRYAALATDYDGTLATHGRVDGPTIAALERFRASGRPLVMVTGRELDDLMKTFDRLDLFDRVVAENGALIYRPGDGSEKVLAEPPPPGFVEALRARGVGPISVGRSVVATWEPHEKAVLEVIHAMGLELQVIFNKGAVMVLPSGVNKATGMAAALDELGLSPHNVVGVGDAENDHAFLAHCECAVAVANALPLLKERADVVTSGDHGAGVVEIMKGMLADDLEALAPRLRRHSVVIGRRADTGADETLAAYGPNVLVIGPRGGGASAVAAGLLGQLDECGYQSLAFDPEGDLTPVAGAVALGTPGRAPIAEEVLDLLKKPRPSVVVSLKAVPEARRPDFFEVLLPGLQDLRARTGRPHWVAAGEADRLLAALTAPRAGPLPSPGLLLVTAHPDRLARPVLDAVDLIVAVGDPPGPSVEAFCRAAGVPVPPAMPARLGPGEALVWRRREGAAPVVVTRDTPVR
jgi:hydroxymethylpyrimidine pyrophosphatase-like HAD family hydrolase